MGRRLFRVSPELIVEICRVKPEPTPPDFTLKVENGFPPDGKVVKWEHVYNDNTLVATLESGEWDEQEPPPEIESPTVHIRTWPR